MAQPHAVEVLLRPAVELHTVAVCTGAAILCLVAPWSLALNPLLGLGSALAFLIFGEGFAPLQFFGFSLLLLGIYLAAKGEKG